MTGWVIFQSGQFSTLHLLFRLAASKSIFMFPIIIKQDYNFLKVSVVYVSRFYRERKTNLNHKLYGKDNSDISSTWCKWINK